MVDPVEIVPDVFAIPLFRVRAFLLADERLTLIDAGLPGSRARIERALGRIGRHLDELERIIVTHGHPDHVGGAGEVAGPGVSVLMHPADEALVRMRLREAVRRPSRGHLFASVSRAPARVTHLADGQVLPVLGGLQVVHTPGHTPGSICLYLPRHRILFTGDALERRRGQVTFASPIFSSDARRARSSVQRLAELDVETIAFSHFPPWRAETRAVLRALAARGGSEATT